MESRVFLCLPLSCHDSHALAGSGAFLLSLTLSESKSKNHTTKRTTTDLIESFSCLKTIIMDTTPRYGISPKKSPSTERIQNRRRHREKSERAAYWAIFNTSVALLLYYDLCYIHVLGGLLVHLEWLICAIFTVSACYDFIIHFWSYTFMKPIVVSPAEKRLLGITEEELGFKIEDPPVPKSEPVFDSLPPFEIQHSFYEEDDNHLSQSNVSQTSLSQFELSRRSEQHSL